MKRIQFIFIIVALNFLTQSCKNNIKRQEEFINLNQTKIDSNHFSAQIVSKTNSDSTILYSDTIVGKLLEGSELQTEWFDDSVNCIVPNYIPENKFQTHTGLKVVLQHKQ
ncbi:hypothetical protein FNO01nite_33960 [Flavobacterium noncentrifugens]|uniref:Uncharacterized protein n=1 Tax=Flavobacterium noncentrifugens TaxID=1128970 RepID=A0A1G9DCV6_9FLAO|nr:hypothetical protein [Flavobacterium noncentrifugens]GEP52724.1 hypothetical protein FNO01nite_33960 [Flavobacterium noncentrifugens]SDK61693.1 hypothetical protein SAMN04487935_3783 [Flavobacterium noncentrifugens]